MEVSTDGGRRWEEAKLQKPVLPLAHTRFRYPWVWDGRETILMSRATDDKGNVQPALDALVRERGLDSLYHSHAIQAWKVDRDGNVVSTHESFALAPLGAARDSYQLWNHGCLA